jgi:hypothetical protein
VSARASTVTYTRDADGNLVKVCLPAKDVSSPKANVHAANVQTAKAPAATKASTEPAQTKPRHATKPRSAAPAWTRPIPPVVRLVAESVAARYGVSVDAILSGERFRDTVRARHEWWRLVKDTWDLSYPEMGRLVGGVDHTSIMSALRAGGDGSLLKTNAQVTPQRCLQRTFFGSSVSGMQEIKKTHTQEAAHTPDCEPERTESSLCWTESVEDYGAQRSEESIPDTLRIITPEDAARAALYGVAGELGRDEVRVLTRIGERLKAGRRAYGPLDLATDTRAFRTTEAREELEDALVYLACAWLKAEIQEVA